MQYYVYMITNKHNTVLYTGFTNNLTRRIFVHREHMDPKSFTARYNVEKLVYYETTTDVRAAIERKKQIKGWNRNRKNKLVEKMNPEWKDLFFRNFKLISRRLPRQCAHWLAMTPLSVGLILLRSIYADRK